MFLCPLLLRVQLFLMDFHLSQHLLFLIFVSMALTSLSPPCHIKPFPSSYDPKQCPGEKATKCNSWVGDNQASRTNRKKKKQTHITAFFVPQRICHQVVFLLPFFIPMLILKIFVKALVLPDFADVSDLIAK